jgi:hypothetical protein
MISHAAEPEKWLLSFDLTSEPTDRVAAGSCLLFGQRHKKVADENPEVDFSFIVSVSAESVD